MLYFLVFPFRLLLGYEKVIFLGCEVIYDATGSRIVMASPFRLQSLFS